MKKLNLMQIVRLQRTLRTKRFELSKIYESLEVSATDLEDPKILNSFYQIQIAVSALVTFEENAMSVKNRLIELSTIRNPKK